MDAQKFGAFIRSRRKDLDMTQEELGAKLNVTDKAISRWERGIGFPDVKLLEPLAGALQISVHELMKCERIESEQTAEQMPDKSDDILAGKSLRLRKHRNRLAMLCFIVYALFDKLSKGPLNVDLLSWISPLTRILFLVTVGSFLYASYWGKNHGTH